MSKRENNKLNEYFNSHIAPALEAQGYWKSPLNKVPFGLNGRRLNDLKDLVYDRFDDQVSRNGRRGIITVVKDPVKGVISIDLDGVSRPKRIKRDRSRSYAAKMVSH